MKSRAASTPAGNVRVRPGFTLLELVIVVVLLVTISVFSIGAFVGFYQTTLVDDAARNIKDLMRRARTQAVAQRNAASYGVKYQAVSSSVILFQGTTFATRVQSEDESLDLPTSITVSTTASEIVFSRLYGTSTASTTWQITNGGVSELLLINSVGTVRLQ